PSLTRRDKTGFHSPSLERRAKVMLALRGSPKTRANCSRRDFLTQAVAAPAIIFATSTVAHQRWEQTVIRSPNGRIHFNFSPDPGRLRYFITLDNQKTIDWSILAILLDGVDISEGANVGKIERYSIRETYRTR